MEREVKLWAKTLLTAYPHLHEAAFQADRRLMDEALGSWRSLRAAEDMCRRIQDLVEVKESYINAKVAVEECLRRLAEKFRRMLTCRYFKKLTYETIAAVAKVSRRNVVYNAEAALSAFAKIMLERGYDGARLKELFGANPFLLLIKQRLSEGAEECPFRKYEAYRV